MRAVRTTMALAAVSAAMLVTHGFAYALPAFPGAEGFGTETPGGRGGRVIAVTNLNDHGAGSLRAACAALGPRTIVFRVGGTIRLKSRLRITEPFLTIAGQTAPGGGILLRDAGLWVETHDVVIRFIRVRIGPSLVEPYDEQDPIHVEGEDCYNVVIDHCSFSWSVDECSSARGPAHDVTFSYNIIAEGLRQPFTKEEIGKERSHSMAMMLGGNLDRCTIHHNLLAHCNSRNPRIQGGLHAFVNNVVYDWGFLTGTFSRNPQVNFIGNYYKRGGASRDLLPVEGEAAGTGRVYVKGNRSPRRPTDDLPEWENTVNAPAAEHQALEPFPMAPLTITTAEEAYRDVLAHAGAALPRRDSVDLRVIRDTRLGMGHVIDRPDQVGGYPDIADGLAPRDTDGDGMPDAWEKAHGLNPKKPANGPEDRDGDGYTSLEDYLNSLVSDWQEAPAKVITYPVESDPTAPFTVEAGGRNVPIESVGQENKVYYARFQFSKSARVTVTAKAEGEIEATLEPARYRNDIRLANNIMSFTVDEPGPRILRFTADGDPLPLIFVIADAFDDAAPDVRSPDVLDVRAHGVTAGQALETEAIQTEAIQAVLDKCAQRDGGGTVYFRPGTYRTGTIRIGSNTTVYLAPGAVIQGSENPDDYPERRGQKHAGSPAFVVFDHAHNSRLTGYGTIDGMGHIVRNRHGQHVHALDVEESRNIVIENVVLRNSASWTCHVVGSEDVDIRNLKIITDWKVGNTDGINPDSSRNISIRGLFGYCGDDAIALKTTGRAETLKPTENVTVRDCVVMTRKTSLKLGTESRADIRHVLFEDIDIIGSSRGIGLWMRDGATFEDIVFRDINMDLHEIPGEHMSGQPFRITVEERGGIGKIRNVLFDRVKSAAPYGSIICGHPESPVDDIKFWGVEWTIKPREIKMDRRPVLAMSRLKNVQFRLIKLHWATDRTLWDGFLGMSEAENITLRELQETEE